MSLSSTPVRVGDLLTITATVAGTPLATGSYPALPTGNVQFFNGTSLLATVAVDGNGVATFSESTFPAGTLTLTAAYVGDGNYAPTTSAAMTETVIENGATISVSADPNSFTYGTSVSLSAVVVGGAGQAVPTGNVSFVDVNSPLGTLPLDDQGQVTLTTAALVGGNHQVVANYAGDGNFAPATATAIIAVLRATSSLSLTATVAASSAAQLSATLTTTPGGATGMVTFLANTTVLGSSAVNSAGQASFSASSLPANTTNLYARYEGDGNFMPSAATPVPVTVATTTPAVAQHSGCSAVAADGAMGLIYLALLGVARLMPWRKRSTG